MYNVLLYSFPQEGKDNFFLYPVESGFLVFLLGGLALLAIYHLFLYFQNRNSIYLLYASYLFFIILSQNGHISSGFLAPVFQSLGKFRYFSVFYTEVYYLIYFFFAFEFLNIKVDFPKWYRYLRYSLYILIVYTLGQFILYYYLDDFHLNLKIYHVFVLSNLIISVLFYILFFKSKRPLKYYLITGSLLLLIFSVLSLVTYGISQARGVSTEWSFSFLYLGFLLENIVFSLGLGKKQRIIADERNQVQNQLIQQLKENEELEVRFRNKLEREIENLKVKLEQDTKERLTAFYEKELVELKLASLRSQMNPHFIFNSLNSIKGFIIDNNQKDAVYYLNKFSKLIRKILSSSIEKDISLAEEIEIAELYLQVENIRFNNEIEFELNIDNELALNSIKVPALILQPFLENAIWHGLASKEGNRRIVLSILKDKDTIEVIIEDNGIGRARSKKLKEK